LKQTTGCVFGCFLQVTTGEESEEGMKPLQISLSRAATVPVVQKAFSVIPDCFGASFVILVCLIYCLFNFKFCGFVTCKSGCLKK